jgi:hypothetical protein
MLISGKSALRLLVCRAINQAWDGLNVNKASEDASQVSGDFSNQ